MGLTSITVPTFALKLEVCPAVCTDPRRAHISNSLLNVSNARSLFDGFLGLLVHHLLSFLIPKAESQEAEELLNDFFGIGSF